jgi:hypothetical protein
MVLAFSERSIWACFRAWRSGTWIGHLMNIPLAARFRTQVLEPIVFDRTGYEASLNPRYVQQGYARVVNTMQSSLDQLVAEVGA